MYKNVAHLMQGKNTLLRKLSLEGEDYNVGHHFKEGSVEHIQFLLAFPDLSQKRSVL